MMQREKPAAANLIKSRDSGAHARRLRRSNVVAVEFGSYAEFWIFRNELGWHWVSRCSTRSSSGAFRLKRECLADARRRLL